MMSPRLSSSGDSPPASEEGAAVDGAALMAMLWVDGGQCLVVSNVADDGPAAAAGVHKGSLVLEVNGEAVVFAGSDPFSVLGVAPDEDAAGVRRAWREKVLLLHPDKGGDAASWHTIKAAYEVLRDERSRKRASTCRRAVAAGDAAADAAPRVAEADAAVGEFGFDDAPPIDRRDGDVSWHRVFDASPEHDDGVSGAPFACLSTALAACYGGEVVEGEDRPVEYVDERPLAPPAAPDAWRAAILADRGEGPKPKTIHVDVARSASPDASPSASPSPIPPRALATQAEATAQAARSAEHAAASADANAAAARRACDERARAGDVRRLAARRRGAGAPWSATDDAVLELSARVRRASASA
ncbi:hypothetical protein JL722_14064 [Aureococcus anophagefferens]|nr:hypothetical protein JL722_14064 [Aureococcus anophagefferens]